MGKEEHKCLGNTENTILYLIISPDTVIKEYIEKPGNFTNFLTKEKPRRKAIRSDRERWESTLGPQSTQGILSGGEVLAISSNFKHFLFSLKKEP